MLIKIPDDYKAFLEHLNRLGIPYELIDEEENKDE